MSSATHLARQLALGTALVLIVAACARIEENPTMPVTARQSNRSPYSTQDVSPGASTFDELMLGLTASAPGFAGLYVDTTGQMVVLSVASSDPLQSEDAVREWFAQTRRDLPVSVRRQQAERSFAQLFNTRRTLNPFAQSGVNYVDIDEKLNRVVIGVDAPRDSVAMLAHASRQGVAASEIVVRIMRRPIPSTELWDYIRPLQGGIAITTRDGFGNFVGSSIGVIARFPGDGSRYAVTCSHCTPQLFGMPNPSELFQPDWTLPDSLVGVEAVDPSPSFGPPNCDPYTVCRQSDAALFYLYNSSNPFTIAHTTWVSVTPGAKGSTTLATPSFDVTGVVPYSNLLVGQGLNHVGRTTGWSAGSITNTCVDRNESGVVVRCNMIMQATAGQGDSGSPVFQWYGGSTGWSANAAGIVWACESIDWVDNLGRAICSRFAFSPWQQVVRDLGLNLVPNP